MGRRTGTEGQAYQVKNTFVELEDTSGLGVRSNRAFSANDADQLPSSQDSKFQAQTPSPFLHPAQAPENAQFMAMAMPQGYGLDAPNMAIAFGDVPAEYNMAAYNEENMVNYGQNMAMYDPNSGMYMMYDWQQQQQQMYNSGYYPMMGGMQCQGDFGQIQDSSNNTEQLLQALSEKLAADAPAGGQAYAIGENGLPEAVGGPCDVLPGQEAYMDHSRTDHYTFDGNAMNGVRELGGKQQNDRGPGGRKNRNRDRGEGGDHEARADNHREAEVCQHGPVNFTTVMFRNIPNKYTREMLVDQLNQELHGQFDFVYLPIDFKNKCNVGYAFINFRTCQACEKFLNEFNGVDVRKCLPGLNSRKVTEVTPARVQGFEENVQRLRNSPVMNELVHHIEWMPLVFDDNGDQQPFPMPERALEAIKPRRRGREERD